MVWLASGIANVEKPASLNLFDSFSKEKASPSDWVKENQIHVYNDKVVIDLENAKWGKFTDTNSMDPVLDINCNSIELVPEKPEQIEEGQIVTYKSEYADGVIIHRVIQKGQDEQGTYFTLKGDNNSAADPGKVRFNQIETVVVGILC